MCARKKWSIRELVVDNYVGNKNNRKVVSNPTLKDVRSAVDSLDGGNKSSLCIVGADDSVFCVGGGKEGYHVSLTGSDSVHILTNSAKGDKEVKLIIGSVLTPLPARYVVSREAALDAASYYYTDGGLAPTLDWSVS